jgi:TolB-like protein/Tfp pilus assembly protein PilF
VEQIKRLLEAPRKATPGTRPAAVAPAASTSAAPRSSGSAKWIIAALSAAVLALAAYVVLRPSGKEATPTAKPVAAAPAVAPVPAAPVLAATTLPSLANDKSIAVLPFDNLSEDKDASAFFADGMHEDILTNLANIPELRVVSRTSVMEYRHTTKKIPQIARELGVAYILEGSVRRSGNQVRITGQLIRAANDEHLWAKSYDRELTPKEIFAIQAALSTEIAGALKAAISPETKKLVERRPTENLAAYELYLKARGLGQVARTDLEKRVKFMEDALALDPNFAEAWGELAGAHAAHVFQMYDRTPGRLAQAGAAINHAVSLAPDNPEIIRQLGRYAYFGYRDYPRATAQYEKGIRLQPNNASAIFNLGAVQRRQGRWLESVTNMRRALELDPRGMEIMGNLVGSLISGRRWNEARALSRKLFETDPSYELQSSNGNSSARVEFLATGSTKQGDEWLAQLSPAQLASPPIMAWRKRWAVLKGDYAEWQRLDKIQPFDGENASRAEETANAAMMLAAHGDRAGATTRLGGSLAEVRAELLVQPSNAKLWAALSRMEALLGQKEAALRDARQAVELLPESVDAILGTVFTANLAAVYAWSGDKDRAIAEITRLLHIPTTSFGDSWVSAIDIHTLRVTPQFFPLRGDPRFEALLKDPKNHEPLF